MMSIVGKAWNRLLVGMTSPGMAGALPWGYERSQFLGSGRDGDRQ